MHTNTQQIYCYEINYFCKIIIHFHNVKEKKKSCLFRRIKNLKISTLIENNRKNVDRGVARLSYYVI